MLWTTWLINTVPETRFCRGPPSGWCGLALLIQSYPDPKHAPYRVFPKKKGQTFSTCQLTWHSQLCSCREACVCPAWMFQAWSDVGTFCVSRAHDGWVLWYAPPCSTSCQSLFDAFRAPGRLIVTSGFLLTSRRVSKPDAALQLPLTLDKRYCKKYMAIKSSHELARLFAGICFRVTKVLNEKTCMTKISFSRGSKALAILVTIRNASFSNQQHMVMPWRGNKSASMHSHWNAGWSSWLLYRTSRYTIQCACRECRYNDFIKSSSLLFWPWCLLGHSWHEHKMTSL